MDRAWGAVDEIFHYDAADDVSTIQIKQDVEPIIEANKREQAAGDGYSRAGRWLRKVARIPLVVAERWMREDGINWMALPKAEKNAYLRRKLMDPDNRNLNTTEKPAWDRAKAPSERTTPGGLIIPPGVGYG